jgi:hypothetical protein
MDKNFNIEKELDIFFAGFIKLLLNLHYIFKRAAKFKLAYSYILEANEICDII